MKQEFTGDIERAEHSSSVPQTWVASSYVVAGEPQSRPLSVQWSREARLKYARKRARPLCIRADDAALDEQCRATLRKLVRAGCTRANHPYSLEQFQVAEQELRHLKQHGFVHAEASALLQPVLQSCERQKTGADVGKITVVLNVHLY